MHRARIIVVAGCLLAVACSNDALFLTAPPEDFGAELLFIEVEGDAERSRLLALDSVDGARPLDAELFVDDTIDLRAGVFDEDLCALALPSGAIPTSAPAQGRCLPEPQRVYAARVVDGRIDSSWELDDAPLFEDAYRHVEPGTCDDGLLACLASGGCRADEDAECGVCLARRPEVTIDPLDDPAEPEPPTWGFGSGGWVRREFVDPALLLRRPWPIGTVPCGDGRVLYPGSAVCHPRDCSPDRWPSDLGGAANVVYVDGAVTSGDGSIDAPFATIQEALDVAPAGATIALARGEHEIRYLRPQRPVRIVGTCARGTTIAGNQVAAGTAIRTSVALTMEDLTLDVVPLRDISSYGVAVDADLLTLRRVEVRGGITGVSVDPGAEARLEEVVVSATSSAAIVVRDGRLTAVQVGVTTVRGVGLLVTGDATADLTLLSVFDVAPGEGRSHAVWARDGARLALDLFAVWQIRGTALRADDADLELSTADIRNVDADEEAYGIGIDQRGGSASYNWVYVELPEQIGVRLRETRTATLTNIAVRHLPEVLRGAGMRVEGGAVVMSNVHLANLEDYGLDIAGTATVSDLFVSGIGQADTLEGTGIRVAGDVTLNVAHVIDAHGVGLESYADRLAVGDLTIESGQVGLLARGGDVELERARFSRLVCSASVESPAETVVGSHVAIESARGEGPSPCGLRIEGDSGGAPSVELTSASLRGTPGIEVTSGHLAVSNFWASPLAGHSVAHLHAGASVTFTRAILGAEATVLRIEAGAEATLDGVAASSATSDDPVLHVAGTLVATDLDVDTRSATGATVCAGADVSIEDAQIRGGTTALSIPRGFDASRLSVRTRYLASEYGLCDAVPDPCE